MIGSANAGRKKSIAFGVLGLLLVAIGFSRSVALLPQTGMVDFRNRVVAARQAERGLNPYLFKWDPSYPETLLDPSDEMNVKYTRMTSPPTTLFIHSLFADADYGTQKFMNFVLNWLALFVVAGWLVWKLRLDPGFAVFATGVYAMSALWLFHVERGQQYVYFTLLAALAAVPPSVEGFRAFFQSATAFVRLTAGIAIFAAFREKRPLRTILMSAAIGALLLVPVLVKYPLAWWGDYFAATKDWYFHRFGMAAPTTPPYAFRYPFAPEGDENLFRAWNFGAPGSILHHFAMKFGWMPPYALGLSMTAGLSLFSGWKLWRARNEPLTSFVGRFFSAIYLVDYFLPSPRSGYDAVLFFPVTVLALVELGAVDRTTLRRPETGTIGALFVAIGSAVALEAFVKPYSAPMLVEFFYLLGAGILLGRSVLRSELKAS